MAWNGSGATEASRSGARRSSSKGRQSVVVFLVVAVALLCIAGWWFAAHRETTPEPELLLTIKKIKRPATRMTSSPRDAVQKAMATSGSVQVTEGEKKRPRKPVGIFDPFTGPDRVVAESLQSALDAENFSLAVRAATEALTSTNVALRVHAVDALGWFGAEALAELTGAMADSSEEVRQTAENYFEQALQEIENPEDQFNIAMAAFGALTDDDLLTSLGGIISGVSSELIDNAADADSADENRLKVVQSLVDIIEGNASDKNVEAAKGLYHDITCSEWQSVDEADRYLSDPENYSTDEL